MKLGEIASERDEMRQIIMDMGQEGMLHDIRNSSVYFEEIRPSTPKRTPDMIE